MRDTDRKIVAEAIRTQARPLWTVVDRTEFRGQHRVDLVTQYDEMLVLWYGKAEQLTMATYTHWNDKGETVCREEITRQKRKRVLHLIGAGNRDHAKSAAL